MEPETSANAPTDAGASSSSSAAGSSSNAGGSVVLRLSGSRKSSTTFAELRRLGRQSSGSLPVSRSFLQQAIGASGGNGLGEVLLLQERDAQGNANAEGRVAGWQRQEGLGTFLGVFVPCTCTIFGVVVFLRLGFVVGQAGVAYSLLIILMSFGLCLLTTLSLCSLIGDASDSHASSTESGSTRQPTLDPGIYCALRRGVGPELGAALGLAFYMAFTVDAAFYITGFGTMLNSALRDELTGADAVDVFPWNPPGTWIEVLIASAALLLVGLCCMRGVVASARVSLATLIGIMLCIVITLLCVLIPPANGPGPLNHTGFSMETLAMNMHQEIAPIAWGHTKGVTESSLMLMFVLVFPGFTGVLAGSNLSGYLRTPTRSIARGSLSSLCFVLLTYAAIIFSLGASVERSTLKSRGHVFILNDIAEEQFFSLLRWRAPIGHIGVGLTTLTSALSYLLGAPRVLQAIARDSDYWILQYLGKGSGPNGEPLRALLLTWAIAQLILIFGAGFINVLASIVTALFLLLGHLCSRGFIQFS